MASLNKSHHESSINPARAGIGLRPPHYHVLLALLDAPTAASAPASTPAKVSFLEIHSENYFGAGGPPLRYLERFREDYAMSAHGVGLSLGSADRLDQQHLQKLKKLVDWLEPALVSEHLCWVGVDGRYLNDLLPVPYTEESLANVVAHVSQTQDFLGRKILIENLSSYLEFADSTMTEWDFLNEVARRSGCGILLDVNNIYVNAVNHGFDAFEYLNAIRAEDVGEIHLAGFQDTGEILIDTHGAAVATPVWALYEAAIARFGAVPTLIEWDTDIPPLGVLLGEAEKANCVLSRAVDSVDALDLSNKAQVADHAA